MNKLEKLFKDSAIKKSQLRMIVGGVEAATESSTNSVVTFCTPSGQTGTNTITDCKDDKGKITEFCSNIVVS